MRRVVAQGLIRLGIAVGVASAVAIGLDQLMNRDTAVGFYIVGGAVLAVAFMTSASDITTPYYYTQGEREFRVRMSFAYVLAGALVVGIGVAIEAL